MVAERFNPIILLPRAMMSYSMSPTVIPWVELALQFGSHYARLRDFKAALITELKKVLMVYGRSQVEALEDGLLIKPSLTHIEKKSK